MKSFLEKREPTVQALYAESWRETAKRCWNNLLLSQRIVLGVAAVLTVSLAGWGWVAACLLRQKQILSPHLQKSELRHQKPRGRNQTGAAGQPTRKLVLPPFLLKDVRETTSLQEVVSGFVSRLTGMSRSK